MKKSAKFDVDPEKVVTHSHHEQLGGPTTPRYNAASGASISEIPSKSDAGISSTGGESQLGRTGSEWKAAERRLVRKLDMWIMPLTTLLYLAAYLDRGNLGNAKIQGLVGDILGGDENGKKYALLSAFFYISYLVFQIPLTLTAKRFPPNIVIGIVTIIWGLSSALQAFAFNYPGILVCRFLLGFAEAGFGPVVPFYYSSWYLKSEIGVRTTIFIAAAPLSGSFSGLIAYGVQHIKSHIATWRILFLIEGLPTILLGILVLILLPGRIETTRILNEEERALAHARINREVSGETTGQINWKHAFSAAYDWRVWMVALMYQGLNVALSSISNFLPTIVSSFGYEGADAQLFTVPPYAVAGVVMICVAVASDRLKLRGPFIATMLLISGSGYAILLGTSPNAYHARYAAVFLAVMGTYTGIPLAMAWTSNNSGSESKRAVSLAMLNTVGHGMSVLGSYIYPSPDKPKYTKGFSVCMAFAFWAAFLATVQSIALWYVNRNRDRKEGKPVQGERPDTLADADKAEGFRYVI